jgi:transposase-like protein
MNALPKSAQPAARAALCEVRDAEDRAHALKAIESFKKAYEAKWPKAVDKVVKDADALLAFFDFPAKHWVHLKTTNPIESTFATVRLRTKVTKGPGSRAAGLAMAYKLIESAQTRWRPLTRRSSFPLVRAGVVFEKGVMAERSEADENEVAA